MQAELCSSYIYNIVSFLFLIIDEYCLEFSDRSKLFWL